MIVLLPRQRLAVVTLANANLELPLPGGSSSLQRIGRGVVSLVVGEQPSTGIAFTWFYVVFDAAVVLILAVLVWSFARLLRRRRRLVHGWRLAIRMLRAAVEAAAGFFLLALPVLAGQGWAGALLWWPDLALVLLAVGGLLILIGALRVTAQILARTAAAPEPALASTATVLPHSGAHARPRRIRFAERRPPSLVAPRGRAPRAVMRGVENHASAQDT